MRNNVGMASGISRKLAVLPLIVAALFVLPALISSFLVTILIEIMTLGLFAMSFNLLFGYTGMLSFGHAAYYGAAAYGVGILLSGPIFVPAIDSFVFALIGGILTGTLLAGIFGAICVQRGDLTFAILTLAFNMMLYFVVSQWTALTGGSDGVLLSPPSVNLGFTIFDPLNQLSYYYLVLLILLISVWLLWKIVNSPYGEVLIAIRENPERSVFSGVPVKYYQWSAFLISGFFTSVAGALAATLIYAVSPDVMHWSVSAEPIIVTLLGGTSLFFGPLIGAAMFIVLEELLVNLIQYWEFGLGIILTLLVIYLPEGVAKVLYKRVTTFFSESNTMTEQSTEEAE